MSAIDDLAASVAAEDTVIDSAVLLLRGIPGLIARAGTDPDKLAALQSDIRANTATLSAAVFSGTPTPTPARTEPTITAEVANAAAATAVAQDQPPAQPAPEVAPPYVAPARASTSTTYNT